MPRAITPQKTRISSSTWQSPNARLGAKTSTKMSSVLTDLVAAKELKIVSAMHDIATGRVTFME